MPTSEVEILWSQLVIQAALVALFLLVLLLVANQLFARLGQGFPKGPTDPRRDDFSELQRLLPALWTKLISQTRSESVQNAAYRYWLPTLERLKGTDQELFTYLDERLLRYEKQQLNRYLYGTGVLELVKALEAGTETTLLLKGVKKVNGALGAWLEHSSRLWPGKGKVRSILQTKNNLLGNLIEAQATGQEPAVL